MAYKSVTITDLFNAGVHIGHLSRHWDSRMWKYVYGISDGTHVIDLVKTKRLLIQACNYVNQAAKEGKTFFFVGSKEGISKVVEEQAEKCNNSSFVSGHWVGGTLTNWSTVRNRVEWLRKAVGDSEQKTDESEGKLSKTGLSETRLSKRELSKLRKERLSLSRKIAKRLVGFRGLLEMTKLPDVVIVVDPREERWAVAECQKLGLPVVAIMDTNCNPSSVDVPIPGNDDGANSVEFILSKLVSAILEGRNSLN
jgi:small subunit ribosomal protein S2